MKISRCWLWMNVGCSQLSVLDIYQVGIYQIKTEKEKRFFWHFGPKGDSNLEEWRKCQHRINFQIFSGHFLLTAFLRNNLHSSRSHLYVLCMQNVSCSQLQESMPIIANLQAQLLHSLGSSKCGASAYESRDSLENGLEYWGPKIV